MMADCRGFTVRQPVECGSDACMRNPRLRVISGLSLPLALELLITSTA